MSDRFRLAARAFRDARAAGASYEVAFAYSRAVYEAGARKGDHQ